MSNNNKENNNTFVNPHWDYFDPDKNTITPAFRSKYILKQGYGDKVQEVILVKGLRALAQNKGLKSIETDIVQFPNAENEWHCLVKATVIGYDLCPITGEVIEVRYTGTGDASKYHTPSKKDRAEGRTETKPGACGNSAVAVAYVRIAETRAIGRALRLYLNIDMVCAEEMINMIEIKDTPINQTQMNTLIAMCNDGVMTQEELFKLCFSKYGKNSPDFLNYDEADEIIKIIIKK